MEERIYKKRIEDGVMRGGLKTGKREKIKLGLKREGWKTE